MPGVLYVVYATGCGHPLMATSDHAGAERLAASSDAFDLKEATDADLEALLGGLRCNTCLAAARGIADHLKAAIHSSGPVLPERTPDQWEHMAVMPGLTRNDPAAIAEVTQGTHDRLLEYAGDKACSAVYWRHFHGAADIRRTLAAIVPDNPTPDLVAVLDQSRSAPQGAPR